MNEIQMELSIKCIQIGSKELRNKSEHFEI